MKLEAQSPAKASHHTYANNPMKSTWDIERNREYFDPLDIRRKEEEASLLREVTERENTHRNLLRHLICACLVTCLLTTFSYNAILPPMEIVEYSESKVLESTQMA